MNTHYPLSWEWRMVILTTNLYSQWNVMCQIEMWFVVDSSEYEELK